MGANLSSGGALVAARGGGVDGVALGADTKLPAHCAYSTDWQSDSVGSNECGHQQQRSYQW